MKRIYVDNASTTPLATSVIEKITHAMEHSYGNPSSIHYHGRQIKTMVEEARKIVAQTIHASVSEIFFTSSATEANNTVLLRAQEDLHIDTIITSPTEHHCILHTLDYLKAKKGLKVKYLSVDTLGRIDLSELDEKLLEYKGKNVLVSLMHGNNEIGTIHPIDKIGEKCKEHGAYFHSDTVQTIGKLNIDVNRVNVNFISASAHKFHGPKGVGFLYMRSDSILQPLIYGGAQERNFRAGTENVTGIIGLAEALKTSIANREEDQLYLKKLKNYFIQKLLIEVSEVKINGNYSDETLNHIISVSFPDGPKADMLMFNLDIAGISASSGSACSSGIEQDSHVLIAIGHDPRRKTIRFSLSTFNTYEEMDEVISTLKLLSPGYDE